MDALFWDRFQFGFTVTYHYIFPQLTMGLALLIVLLKLGAYRTRDEARARLYDDVARFLARIFGVNFALGVVTGIPMEFQFGTNWSRFSRTTGGAIGLTLALEGLFAFFAESAFLGVFLFGERRLSRRAHLGAAIMLFVGSWLSGYFIIVTNAFMQHPVGHAIRPDGSFVLVDIAAYMLNPWALWEYAHNMSAAVITGGFVVAALGAYYALAQRHAEHARVLLRLGVVAALVASVLQLFPTGDGHGKMVAKYQRPALAAMEGKFQSSDRAELVLIGQPDVANHRLDNPVVVPWALSFLAYGSFGATVVGLDDVPPVNRPDNVELLYYAYHVMVGLGTLLLLVALLATIQLARRRLETSRALLWVIMLSFPFPYIATTAGWMTAEIGRQPWTVYGLLRTADSTSPRVSAGTVAFSTLGWLGLYLAIGIVFLFLVARIVARGPSPATGSAPEGAH